MNITAILIAAAVIAVAGIIVGIGLGLFGEKFKVEVDEKEVAIREELPGNNCGGCGFAGCDALAKAIAEGKAPANACPVGEMCIRDSHYPECPLCKGCPGAFPFCADRYAD